MRKNISKLLKNKSSVVVNFEFLLRLIAVILLVWAFFFIGCKLKSNILDSEQQYTESFENLVEQVNEMILPQDTFSLTLKEKSALIGFSKGSDKWECYNCYGDKVIFEKPVMDAECIEACICLCEELDFDEKDNTRSGKCKKSTCRKLNYNIADRTMIRKDKQWNNGFLFVNGISGANGLEKYDDQILTLYADKINDYIGFCNSDMLKFNKETLNLPPRTCINKDWETKK